MVKLRDAFLRERWSIWESLHWYRNELKILKSNIMDHILLEGHNATYSDFSILILFLIKRDKPELNRNIYIHPLEIFQ